MILWSGFGLGGPMALPGGASIGQWRPTDSMTAVKDELFAAIDEQLATWRTLRDTDVPALNDKARELAMPAVKLEEKEDEGD